MNPFEQAIQQDQDQAAVPQPVNPFQANIDAENAPKPSMVPLRNMFEENLKAYREKQAEPKPVAAEGENKTPQAPPKAADSFLEALEAGWQMSVTGLAKRGKNPDIIEPADAPMAFRIASQAATLAGDAPAMLAGWLGGAAAGASATAPAAVVPGIGEAVVGAGALVGGGAGAMALPTAMRRILMDHYQKGDIKDFHDFWSRASATFLDTFKSGVVGGLTAGSGELVGQMAEPISAPFVKQGLTAASQVATMVTVGKALEGQVPNAKDFADAAVLVAGLHGVSVAGGKIAGKLRGVYSETGIPPLQVAELAKQDPSIAQDLVSENKDFPEALSDLKDKVVSQGPPPFPPKEALKPPKDILEPNEVVKEEGDKAPKIEMEPLPEKLTKETERETEPKDGSVASKIVPSEGKTTPVTWDEAYRKYMDDLHPLKQFTDFLKGDKVLDAKDDPYKLARLYRGSYGKADQFLEHAPFDFETLKNTGTRPLKSILEPFKDDLDGLRQYLVSSRAIELESRGIQSGIPLDGPEGARAIAKAGKEKYGSAAKEIVDFQNDTLKYLKDSGVLSQEAFDKMIEANKSYVPFFRLMDEGNPAGKGSPRGLTVRNPVKGIEGSSRAVIDPIESIIKNTYAYITMAERNHVMTAMADLADKSESGSQLMEKLPTPMKPVTVKAEEVERFLQQHGIEGEGADFTIFRSKAQALASDEVAVYRDGQRQIYRVSPEIATALKAFDRESMNIWTQLLAKPASMLRAGSILAPDFIGRHNIRNQLNAFVLSRNGYNLGAYFSGLGSVLNEDEAFQNWQKGGGGNAAMVAIDRDYIQNNVFKLNKETGFLSAAQNVVKHPFEMLRGLCELSENATRVAEFKKALENGKSIQEAAFDSREVTLDFLRIGAKTRAMNAITAFWNVHVQGLDRTVRAFQERPLETTSKVMAAITLPSVLLWFANKDDKRYQELPRWQKDVSWIVPIDKWEDAEPGFSAPVDGANVREKNGKLQINNGPILRIPKPFELGIVFGTVPERILDAFFTDHPRALKDLGKTILGSVVPEYMPTAVTPFIEHFANKSTFTGNSIVPGSVEKRLPAYQYTPYTTEAAKALSRFTYNNLGVGFSPAIAENYAKAFSGGLGSYALQTADFLLRKAGVVPDPVKPESTLSDIPFVKAFVVRYPASNARSIQDFRDRYQPYEQTLETIKGLMKEGAIQQAEELFGQNKDQILKLDGISQTQSRLSSFIQKIYQNPDMTPKDKRRLIDSSYFMMIETAQQGNKILDELESRRGSPGQ